MANKNVAKINWTVDKNAFRNLLGQPEVAGWVEGITDDVLARAGQIARQEALETGAYASSFRKKMEKSRNGDRPVGVISTNDHKWVWIEYGTATRPAKAVIRRAVDGQRGKK